MISPIRNLSTGNPVTDRELLEVQKKVQAIIDCPLLQGNLLRDVELTTGNKLVPHGLGRRATGYFVVRKSANVSVWDTGTTPLHLALAASGPATVTLWAF